MDSDSLPHGLHQVEIVYTECMTDDERYDGPIFSIVARMEDGHLITLNLYDKYLVGEKILVVKSVDDMLVIPPMVRIHNVVEPR